MKKIITATTVIAVLAGLLCTGCNKDKNVDESIVQDDKKGDESIVQDDKKGDESIVPKDYKVGESIDFGHYEQDNDTTNGKEPIAWRILDKNTSGQYLIISEKVLDNKPYNEKKTDITWEKSTIRSWLNGYEASHNTVGQDYTSENFIDTAFSDAEKAKIIASDVPAHKSPEPHYPSPGNATMDKVFMLSVVEADDKYFTSDENRKTNATRYAVEKGVLVDKKACTDDRCPTNWWLRTPGFDANRASYVMFDGSANDDGSVVHNSNGVRPALWVQL